MSTNVTVDMETILVGQCCQECQGVLSVLPTMSKGGQKTTQGAAGDDASDRTAILTCGHECHCTASKYIQ